MKNIKSVEKRPDGSTHWVMDGPLGKKVEWDAETTMFEPNKRIAWHSREGSAIKTSGQVTFVELGTGQTQVNLTIQWVVPPSKGGETPGRPDRGSREARRAGPLQLQDLRRGAQGDRSSVGAPPRRVSHRATCQVNTTPAAVQKDHRRAGLTATRGSRLSARIPTASATGVAAARPGETRDGPEGDGADFATCWRRPCR